MYQIEPGPEDTGINVCTKIAPQSLKKTKQKPKPVPKASSGRPKEYKGDLNKNNFFWLGLCGCHKGTTPLSAAGVQLTDGCQLEHLRLLA